MRTEAGLVIKALDEKPSKSGEKRAIKDKPGQPPPLPRVRRGDVVMVNLREPRGSEQGKVRPAVIISNDIGNKLGPTVTVVPVTTADKNPWQGTHADLGDLGFLDGRSIALGEQVTTIDKSFIIKWLGRLEPHYMYRVEHAVRVQLYQNVELFDLVCS